MFNAFLNASPLRRDVPDDYPPGSSPARLYEEFHAVWAPKPEELNYVFSDDELKQTAQHFKCKVNMRKFNPLDHFHGIFERRGSLKNRSAKSTLKLLMRAYKRYKDDNDHMYTETDIKEILQEEWEVRKAVFVRFLKQEKEKEKAKNVQQVSNESEDCVIVANKSQPTEPVSVPEMPQYVEDFYAAVNAMSADPQLLQSQASQDDNEPTPILTNSANSLLALDAELNSALNSANSVVSNLQTCDIAKSSSMSSQQNTESTPNSNTEGYQIFNTGNPVSSTQDT